MNYNFNEIWYFNDIFVFDQVLERERKITSLLKYNCFCYSKKDKSVCRRKTFLCESRKLVPKLYLEFIRCFLIKK